MHRTHLQIFILAALFLSACGRGQPTATASPTQTPDPCASDQISTAIKPVNDLQREFDDISLLAANVAQEQLAGLIIEMQRIRREAEDLSIPSCLVTLKTHQLAHMKTVIDTLIAFVGGADATTLNAGIAQAGKEHDLYMLEMARLSGVTLVPAETPSP